MARMDQSLPEITGEQRPAVEAALRQRDLVPRVRERLEMVKAVGLGQDLASVVRWSGRSPRTVRRWVGRFVAGASRPWPTSRGQDARQSRMPATGRRPRRRSRPARVPWGSRLTRGRRRGWRRTWSGRPGSASRQAGSGRC